MIVNVGRAKTELSKLLTLVESGESVIIARDGVPVARLLRFERPTKPGARFLAAEGSLAGRLVIGEEFELDDDDLDEILDEPA